MKLDDACIVDKRTGRSPCGERGLKYLFLGDPKCGSFGRSPCGERGLKYDIVKAGFRLDGCRSPCGERGLK